jgi:protein O-mannosyl-transferase
MAQSSSSEEGASVVAGSLRRSVPAIVGLALIVSTVLVYLPVQQHAFVSFDDPEYVVDNAMVQAGLTWEGVRWAFATTHFSYWHPLTWLSHMLDVELFGPGSAGPHVVNVLIHVANTVLLFGLLRRMTGATWRSAGVAALFALHPLHVESVAWVAERKDVLSALFFLLTLWAYAKYAALRGCRRQRAEGGRGQKSEVSDQRVELREPVSVLRPLTSDLYSSVSSPRRLPGAGWYFAAFVLFALGLMSKPMLVTLPFVLLLLDIWPLRRTRPHSPIPSLPLFLEKLPFFALSAASCVVTLIAQRRNEAVQSLEDFSWFDRIGNAVVAYARYLGKIIWPSELAFLYPHPGTWPATTIAIGAVIVVGATAVALWALRRQRFAFVGWFWFCGMLFPVIGMVQSGAQAMADRYTYLPAIGLFIAVAWGAQSSAARGRVWRYAIGTVSVLAIAACALGTREQLRHWRDSESLFRRALAVTTGNFMAHTNLGNVLLDRGDVDEAITHYETAVSIRPRDSNARNNLGTALLQQGNADQALAHLQEALAIAPNNAAIHHNLGRALRAKWRISEAIAHFRKSIEDQPGFVAAHHSLAATLLDSGRTDEALATFARVLTLTPDDAGIHNEVGWLLVKRNRHDEGIAHLQNAARLAPDFAEAHYNLAIVLMQVGRAQEAITPFRRVLELEPANTEARNNCGWALLQLGRADEAAAEFRTILAQAPDLAVVHRNLARALLRQGHVPDAIAHLDRFLHLQPDDAAALSELAWLRATSPDAAMRDGPRAIELARRANEISGGADPFALQSLAAAQAEQGDFTAALATAQLALQHANSRADVALAEALRVQSRCYEAGAPFRDLTFAAENPNAVR